MNKAKAETSHPVATIDKAKAEEMVTSCQNWYHQIKLPYEITTPGTNDPINKLPRLGIPESLKGKSILDVGANDGYFSFLAEQRGAERVLAIDHPHWTGTYEYTDVKVDSRKVNFETARTILQSKVEDRTISVYDLTEKKVGKFDIVFCFGVIYHLMHPTLGLAKAISLANELVIVESAIHEETRDTPVSEMIFTPVAYANDKTNWWYPNAECIKQMMLTMGCREVIQIWPTADIMNSSRISLHGII